MAEVTEYGVFSEDDYQDVVVACTAGGQPQSLTGWTVQMRLKNLKTGVTIVESSPTIDAAPNTHRVRRPWASVAEVTATERFQYRVRVVATHPNGRKLTFPAPGEPELRITIVPKDT